MSAIATSTPPASSTPIVARAATAMPNAPLTRPTTLTPVIPVREAITR